MGKAIELMAKEALLQLGAADPACALRRGLLDDPCNGGLGQAHLGGDLT
jgi:hypothetical protein